MDGITGDDIIGSRLMIESEGVEPMEGTVIRYNPDTGEHDVLLDSGVTVTLDLNEEEVLMDEGEQYEEEEYDYEEEDNRHHHQSRGHRANNNRHSNHRNGPGKSRGYNIAAYEEDDEDDNRSVNSLGSRGSAIRENYMYEQKKVRRGEEIIGFTVCIFNTEDPSAAPLEGVVTCFDPRTSCHGIKFDTGLELDIDLAEENVSDALHHPCHMPTLVCFVGSPANSPSLPSCCCTV